MMKKCLALFMAIMMVFSSAMGAMAATLELPEDLTKIAAETFEGSASLDEVIVPDGVTAIGSRAFADSSLTSIHVPQSVTSIADDAFDGSADVKGVVKAGSYAQEYFTQKGIPVEVEAAVLPSSGIPVSFTVDKDTVAMGEETLEIRFTTDDGSELPADTWIHCMVVFFDADDNAIGREYYGFDTLEEDYGMLFECAGAASAVICVRESQGISPGQNSTEKIRFTGGDEHTYVNINVVGNPYPGGEVLALATLYNANEDDEPLQITVTDSEGTFTKTLGELSAATPKLSAAVPVPADFRAFDENGVQQDYILLFTIGEDVWTYYLWMEPMCEYSITVNEGETDQLHTRIVPSLMPYTFEVADTSIAAVDADGNVTGIIAGETTGTMTACNGEEFQFNVYVTESSGGSNNAPVFYVTAEKAQVVYGYSDGALFRICSEVEDSLRLDSLISIQYNFYDADNVLMGQFVEEVYVNTDNAVYIMDSWNYWDDRIGEGYRYVEVCLLDSGYEITEPSTARIEVIPAEEAGKLVFEMDRTYGNYVPGDKVSIELTCLTPDLLAAMAGSDTLSVTVVSDSSAFSAFENVEPAIFDAETSTATLSFTVNDQVIPGDSYYLPLMCGYHEIGFFSLNISSGFASYTSSLEILKGRTVQLPVTLVEGTEWSDVYVRVYDPSIVSVDENGLVTGLEEGYSQLELYCETAYGILDNIWIYAHVVEPVSEELPTLNVKPMQSTVDFVKPVSVQLTLSEMIDDEQYLSFGLNMIFYDSRGNELISGYQWCNFEGSALTGEGAVIEVNSWPDDERIYNASTIIIQPMYDSGTDVLYELVYEYTPITITNIPEDVTVIYNLASENGNHCRQGDWLNLYAWRIGGSGEEEISVKDQNGNELVSGWFSDNSSRCYMSFSTENLTPYEDYTLYLYVNGEKVEDAALELVVDESQMYFSNLPTRVGCGEAFTVYAQFNASSYECETTFSTSDESIASFDENHVLTAHSPGTVSIVASCAHQSISQDLMVYNISGTEVPEVSLFSVQTEPLRWRYSTYLGINIDGDLMEIPSSQLRIRCYEQILDAEGDIIYDHKVDGGTTHSVYSQLQSNSSNVYWYDSTLWYKMAELDGYYFRFILMEPSDGSYTIDEENASVVYELQPISEYELPIILTKTPESVVPGEKIEVTFTCINPERLTTSMSVAICSEWGIESALVSGTVTQEAPSITLSYLTTEDYSDRYFYTACQETYGGYTYQSFRVTADVSEE